MSETSTYRIELVSRIRSVTDDIGWATRELAAGQLAYRPSDADWSIHMNLAHLRDMEQRVYLPLLRWATVPDMLDPAVYNRQEWFEQRYDPDESVTSLIGDLNRIRDEELGIFREIDDLTWVRYRDDTRWGPLSCRWIAEVIYRHALDHLQCIMGLRQDIHLADAHPSPGVIVGGYIGGEER